MRSSATKLLGRETRCGGRPRTLRVTPVRDSRAGRFDLSLFSLQRQGGRVGRLVLGTDQGLFWLADDAGAGFSFARCCGLHWVG